MENSVVLVATAFPTVTVGKNINFWPKPSGIISRNEMLLNTAHKFNYGDSKAWRCTYSSGSAPAISISPSTPSTPSPSTPSTPLTPDTPSPSTPSTPSTPSPKTPSPSTPSTPSTPLTPATPSHPPRTPKTSPPPSTPSLPPPTHKKSPSPPQTPSSNPPLEHHHHYENRWEQIDGCMRNMGHAAMCRMQMEMSFFTSMFRVSERCCNLIVNMRNECDDVVWGFSTDPFFVPLVRCTCHVTY